MIFDNGKVKELDHLPALSFKVGAICVPYVSNDGQFKVYFNGESKTLIDQEITKYYVSAYMMVYFVFDQLYVFDNGKSQLLSSNVKHFALGDSLVAFYNENTHSSHIYYKGKVFDLERSLVGNPIQDYTSGDNLFAWFNDNSKYLKVFYHGKVHEILKSASKIEYQPGRDLLAYVDKSRNSFHIFYKANFIDLEDYEPKSFKTGDDIMAYVDNLGSFKIFYAGNVQTISSFEPDFYEVKDSLVIFAEQNYLKVFYKGETHELENYVPKEYQMQESTLAFIGNNGWLQAFTNGKYITVSNDLIKEYYVIYNLIYLINTIDKVRIFYKGQISESY